MAGYVRCCHDIKAPLSLTTRVSFFGDPLGENFFHLKINPVQARESVLATQKHMRGTD